MYLGVRKVLSHTSLQHKAVKDEGGQKGANTLSCLHTTCKAMNLSNPSQVSRKQTFTTDFIKTANLLALTLVPVAVSTSLKKSLLYPGRMTKEVEWGSSQDTVDKRCADSGNIMTLNRGGHVKTWAWCMDTRCFGWAAGCLRCIPSACVQPNRSMKSQECGLHFHKNNALCVAVLPPFHALYPPFVGFPSGSFMWGAPLTLSQVHYKRNERQQNCPGLLFGCFKVIQYY